MATILLVVRHGGEYEDKWQHTLLATPSRTTAERFIKEMKAKDAEFNRVMGLLDEFNSKWYDDNPTEEGEPLEDVPRWPAGLGKHQITDQMRQEREAIQARNHVKIERRQAALKARNERHEEAAKAFLISIGQPAEDYDRYASRYIERDWSYEIEEVQYQE